MVGSLRQPHGTPGLVGVVMSLFSVRRIDPQIALVVLAGELSILEGAADCIERSVGDRLSLRIDGGVSFAMIVVSACVTTLITHVIPSRSSYKTSFPAIRKPDLLSLTLA